MDGRGGGLVRRIGRRGAVGAAGVAAVAALLLSSCQVPLTSAGTLFDAWKAGDQAKAATVATPTAVTSTFSRTYSAADGWLFIGCEAATDPYPYCSWVDRLDQRLSMRTRTSIGKVDTVALSTALPMHQDAGRVFYAWRTKDRPAAEPYASDVALDLLFAKKYVDTARWRRWSCGPGSCLWQDKDGNQIQLVFDPETYEVVNVYFHAG